MTRYLLFAAFIWLGCICPLSTIAQTTETTRVTAGNDIAKAVSAYGMYRLPVFTRGTLFFKDGSLGKESLNYNMLINQMMYIDKKGDTLAIAAPEEIKKTAIDGLVFYYDKKRWLEEITAAAGTSLVVQRTVKINFEKEGAFGMPNPAGSITSYNTYTSGNISYHLFVNEDAVVRKEIIYFLLSAQNEPVPATKKNFLALFSKNKKSIESYLDNNKVNFSKEQDLIQLLSIAVSGN
jgi:hypothetical protein